MSKSKRFFGHATVSAAMLLAGQLACAHAGGGATPPDLVIVDGKIFTADTAKPWVEALAIRGDRIAAVGTTAEMRALAGSSTRIIDVGGRVVTPGFNDAHDHVSAGTPGVALSTSALGQSPSIGLLLDSLHALAGRTPHGVWVRGPLWVAALEDTTLRRAALDRAVPDNPVLLEMPTGHGMIVNSAALRALRIGDVDPDPLGGRYERDTQGRITGKLEEYAGWSALRTLRMSQPDSEMIATLRRYAARELTLGITSVQDMANSLDAATTMSVLQRAQLPIRMHIIKYSIPTATGLAEADWNAGIPAPTDLLRVASRKWILDGTPVEGLALSRREYPGRPGWHGRLNFPIDTMRAMLVRALASKEQLAFHSGDSTTVLLLGLMESIAPDAAWRPLRIRLEHGGGMTPDMWPRVAAKGMVSVQNLQLLPPPQVSRNIPPVPLAAVLPPMIPMGLGSDGEPRSPFTAMAYGLSFPFQPQISRELIVRAYTLGSAYAEFEEIRKGSLTPGKLADLAVLSQDIFTVPVAELTRTTSVLTLVGGRVAYDAHVLGGSIGPR